MSKMKGRQAEAIAEYQTALRPRPDYARAASTWVWRWSRFPAACPKPSAQFETALRADPDSAVAQYNLRAALSNPPGRLPETVAHLEAALRLKPDPELKKAVERLRAGAR